MMGTPDLITYPPPEKPYLGSLSCSLDHQSPIKFSSTCAKHFETKVKKAAREEAERESPLFAALREAKLLPREDGEGIKDKEVDKGKGATVKMEHPRPQHWSCVGISDGEDMDWVWDGETFEVVGLESYGGGLGRGDGSGVEGSGADEVTAERKVCYCGGCARSRIIDIEVSRRRLWPITSPCTDV